MVLLVTFDPLIIIEVQSPELRNIVVFLGNSAKEVPSVVENRVALSGESIELLAAGLGPKSLPSFIVKLVDVEIKWVGLGLRIDDGAAPDV